MKKNIYGSRSKNQSEEQRILVDEFTKVLFLNNRNPKKVNFILLSLFFFFFLI